MTIKYFREELERTGEIVPTGPDASKPRLSDPDPPRKLRAWGHRVGRYTGRFPSFRGPWPGLTWRGLPQAGGYECCRFISIFFSFVFLFWNRFPSVCWARHMDTRGIFGGRTALTEVSSTGTEGVPNLSSAGYRYWGSANITELSFTGIEAVPNHIGGANTPGITLLNCRLSVLGSYRTYRSVGYRYWGRTELTELSPNLPNCRVPVSSFVPHLTGVFCGILRPYRTLRKNSAGNLPSENPWHTLVRSLYTEHTPAGFVSFRKALRYDSFCFVSFRRWFCAVFCFVSCCFLFKFCLVLFWFGTFCMFRFVSFRFVSFALLICFSFRFVWLFLFVFCVVLWTLIL